MARETARSGVERRLLVLTVSELTRDPRARRQVLAAAEHGWQVAGACGCFPGDEPAALADIPIARLQTGKLRPSLRPMARAAGAANGSLSLELRGIYQLVRLLRLTFGLVRIAKTIGPAAIVHANDLDTLPAASLLARRWGGRVVYDAHELYPHKEPRPPRIHRAVIRALERFLARRADAIITVSDQIADELVRTFRVDRPTVVLNGAALQRPVSKTHDDGPLRVVYQASAGTARFPEDLLDAAAETTNVALTLRIAGLDPIALNEEIVTRGLDDRVRVAEPVRPNELVTALDDADVGVVIDRPITLNVAYALPNKLFEYLMAGLAVVVPALPAMGRLVEERAVGVTFEPGSTASLAAALQSLADDRALLRQLQANARGAAETDLNAEHELLKTVAVWEQFSPR